MSSPDGFLASSQLSLISPGRNRRRHSKFTYKHLSLLSQSSTSCPLRVIAHIDLDAFYAQCESVRLGLPEDQPLAVQQWQGIIAINYPARKFGLGRFSNIAEAKKQCPELILQHVATWKEGDEKWAYHEDAWKHIATHKVSLDPYRLESRRIFACIKDTLPPSQRVEKASVDEVFLDLSAQVHSILLERYPELRGPPPYDDPTERLPRPPTTALDWDADALVDLDATETEDDEPDWDDVVVLVGSEIIRQVRAAIRERLKYTCSAGIARNKMIAKLGSGHKKPNNQTIVRTRAIQQFLSDFKFTKIRNLGGKLGDEVVSTFGTDQVTDLLKVSLDQMKSKLGDDTGSWVFHIIRGEDSSEVNPRTQIKSMLSAKSFRPTINTIEQAHKWLRIFIADIFTRLKEEGVLENRRRPKTMNLHHRQGQQTRSRQAPIPTGRVIDEMMLFEIAKNILAQVIVDGRAWPCSNLSLSVGGFEEGPTGNKGIGSFLVRSDEIRKTHDSASRESIADSTTGEARPTKRQRTEGPIRTLFARQSTSHGDTDDSLGIDDTSSERLHRSEAASPSDEHSNGLLPNSRSRSATPAIIGNKELSQSLKATNPPQQTLMPTFLCPRCEISLPEVEREEHDDWHFATDLQRQDTSPKPNLQAHSSNRHSSGRRGAQHSAPKQVEKGQQRLVFGK